MRTTNAPYFSLARAAWIPCVVAWDEETGESYWIEEPDGFTTWREAEDAGRFLSNGARIRQLT
jgi:hypothetical protein